MLSNTGIASFHIIIFILIPLKPREFWGSFVSGLRLTNIHEAEKIPGLDALQYMSQDGHAVHFLNCS